MRVAGVGISHPERVVAEAPGHTKLDVVRYHERMGPWLVPQLAPRPIASPPAAGESAPPFIRVADMAGIVRAVQNGHYEFRTWGASFPRLERPDRIVLRLAVYEFLHQPETPAKVVINEALELARTFSTDDAVRFINGILDAIRRRLQRD